MKFGTMLMLLVAIVAGGIAAFSARTIILKHHVTAGDPQSTIVVASANLNFGTALTADNVTEIPWSASALPQGAFRTKADLLKDGRRVVLSSIAKDEPILVSRVTGPGQRGSLSVLIDKGMRAVTVRVDEVRGVAGFVLPDDHVDVLLSRLRGGGADSKSYAEVLLQNVKVLAVDQVASTKHDRPTVARAVTLEVTAEQAEKLVLAGRVGSLSLVLRKAGGAEPTAARRVTLVDLGQGEYNGGDKAEERLAQRIDQLEARLTGGAGKAAATLSRRSANIRIIRADKSSDYDVYSESD